MSDALLEVKDVTKHFPVTRGIIFRSRSPRSGPSTVSR